MAEKKWNGFYRKDFMFEGKEATVIYPKKKTNNWALKTEYFDAFPELEIELVKKGYHLLFIKNSNRWGCQNDLDVKKRFLDYLIEELKLEAKGVLIGMSCGGLFGIKFAGIYPERVSVLYLDAPVVNILSMLGMGKRKPNETLSKEIYEALSMNPSEIISYREHPLDYLGAIVKEQIPACLVCGDCDRIVDYEENGKLVVDAFSNSTSPFLHIIKQGGDHHPHALQGMKVEEQKKVLNFILTYDKN